MQRIKNCGSRQHVDIGSDVEFVGMLTTHVPVLFVDIRPLDARTKDLCCIAADILKLPFASNSVDSLSCLHVAEHVGLGRYGDVLNPLGTHQACIELARVLAPGGSMFFSVPVGSPRTCFNAHRIHSPEQILDYFSGLHLIEFSIVDDNGNLHLNHSLEQIKGAEYACGLYWLQKPGQEIERSAKRSSRAYTQARQTIDDDDPIRARCSDEDGPNRTGKDAL